MSSSTDFTSLVAQYFGRNKFPKKGFNTKDFRDELLLVSKGCKKVEDHEIDLLISLQYGLRSKWWTKGNPFMALVEAIGYLGQKFDNVTAQIFDRITAEMGKGNWRFELFSCFLPHKCSEN